MPTQGWKLPSITHRFEAPEGHVYITIAEQNGEPYWVDVRVSRAGGSALAAAGNAIAILSGGALRRGLEPSKLRVYLRGIAVVPEEAVENGEFEARSMADALARTIEEWYM